MDVMRTGCSVLGALNQEDESHPKAEAQDIINKLMASLVLCFILVSFCIQWKKN